MRVAVAACIVFALLPGAGAAQGTIERGTIAVIPFGANAPEMREMADALAVAVENALQESGRFIAVLPRAGDGAIKAEVEKTTEPTSLNSLVQIAQDAQLNANYVLAGWVIGQDVKTSGTGAAGTHTAQVRAMIRILDVSTGAMVMSDLVTIHSGPAINCPGGPLGVPCELGRQRYGYATVEEALSSVRTNGNAQSEIQDALTEKLGYIVLDLLEEDGGLQVVLRVVDGDPRRGTKLKMVQSRTSALDESRVYATTIGRLEVSQVDGETAIALVTDGADEIMKALMGKQSVLLLKN